MTAVPEALDRRFREAAAGAGLLDVSYDIADTPVGPLFVAVTERGLCRISYDAEPDRQTEELARTFGTRILRSVRPIDHVKRELEEYFEGRRREFDLPVDLRGRSEFARAVLRELARVPFGEVTTYGALAARSGGAPAPPSRDDHEPEPHPDRPPVPPRRRLDRKPRRLRRRPGAEAAAPRPRARSRLILDFARS
jgi:methylated-DNA-[protein]-cysteine S-methyltransferase